MRRVLCAFSLLSLVLVSWMPFSQAQEDDKGRMQRIDFGNSYVKGQTIKPGAVYLMHRKKSDISSMLKERTSYKEEILEDARFHENMKTKDR